MNLLRNTNNSKIHLWLFFFWVAAFIPSAIWLRNSIFLVIFVSFYAIWITHLSCYEAARAKETAQEVDGESNNLHS